jgi:acetyltransferase-like isoleucine patch superfamily enzyme
MTSQALQIQKGPFVEISPEAQVGFGCTFGSHCFVHKGAVVGANVHIEGGVILHEGVAIEDGVEIGANVVFVRPRNTIGAPATLICRGSQIGGNATLAAGVTVGEQALVEPGSVVLNSVQPYAIVAGNPAKVVGFRGASVAVKTASPAMPAGQGLEIADIMADAKGSAGDSGTILVNLDRSIKKNILDCLKLLKKAKYQLAHFMSLETKTLRLI